jgi:hypothetical protein
MQRCLNCQSNFRLNVFLLFLTPTAVSFFVYSFFCFSHASVLPDFLNWLFTCLLYACHIIQRCVPASAFQQSCSSIRVPAVVFQHSCSNSRVSAPLCQCTIYNLLWVEFLWVGSLHAQSDDPMDQRRIDCDVSF